MYMQHECARSYRTLRDRSKLHRKSCLTDCVNMVWSGRLGMLTYEPTYLVLGLSSWLYVHRTVTFNDPRGH
jgi:hypothetical protein